MALSTLSIPFVTSGAAVSGLFAPTPAPVLPNIVQDGMAHLSLIRRYQITSDGQILDLYGPDINAADSAFALTASTSKESSTSTTSVFRSYTDTMPPPESSKPLSTSTQTTPLADVQDAVATSTTPPVPGKTYVNMSDLPNDTSTSASAYFNYSSSISVAPSLSSAYSCLSSWNLYDAGFSTWETDTTLEPTISIKVSSTKNALPASLHTLCDQVPRGPPGYSEYSTFNTTSTVVPAFTGVANVTTNTITATPTCSVPGNQCFDLASDFSYFTTMTSPNNSTFINPDSGPCKNYNHCNMCEIRARSVELFYWPVATATPLCAGDQSMAAAATITPAPNPSTFVTRGYTMTWPSVYLSVDYIIGLSPERDSNGKHPFCGQPTTNLMVPIPPESLSSIRTIGRSETKWVTVTSSFDFADLNTVPADVYRGMSRCWTDTTTANLCSTIYDDYAPRLVIPDAVRTLVPMWKNCNACLEGVIDPPIALVSATDDALVATSTPSAEAVMAALEPTDNLIPTTTAAAKAMQTSQQAEKKPAATDSGLPKETAKVTADSKHSGDPSPSAGSNGSDQVSDQSVEEAAATAPSDSMANTKTAGVGSAILAALGGDPNPTGSSNSGSGSSSDQIADGNSDGSSPSKNHGTAAQAVPVVVTYSSGTQVAVVTASLNGVSLAQATDASAAPIPVVLTYSSDGQEVKVTTTLDQSQVAEAAAAAAAVATKDSVKDSNNDAEAAVPITLTYSSNGHLAKVTTALDQSQISEAAAGAAIPMTLTYSSNGQLVTATTSLDASQVSKAAAQASAKDGNHNAVPVTLTFSSNGHLTTITTSIDDPFASSSDSGMRTSSSMARSRTTTTHAGASKAAASASNARASESAAWQQKSGVVSVSTALLSLFLAGALLLW